ncbi:HAMP domain-containing histidine kinase [Jeotgalibacillus sp. S-D1]|uniref:sensor histidine kinase n=1 Tax=Jeotgalibacillus sp. S-D1 TaxID=2552189 RepID=UPI00105A170D|nr:HAMP domain-containing sensor histidine kinase [Jeotgalibacillus sp. S-D1]TDL32878.1 HAMP domain-containing histidine kinase [Jeotgalibacillus sp. S-D1]
MKSLRRRLALHFSLQFISIIVLVGIISLVLIFVLLTHLNREAMKQNFPAGALENIAIDTKIEENKATISDAWKQQLKERNLWVQVVDMEGDVIGSENTPELLPDSYSVSEILQIEKTNHYEGFYVYSQVDTTFKEPYFYMLGYDNNERESLQHWFSLYSSNGRISGENLMKLERELEKVEGTIHVVNQEGKVIQSTGSEMMKEYYKPLDVLVRTKSPGKFETSTTIYIDPKSGLTWILHTPKQGEEPVAFSILSEMIRLIIILAVVLLTLTLGISFWQGLRYSQPLLLFTSWLERMGYEKYGEVLTEKERKKVFKKNGKVRLRYKLYKEVIGAFYDMAEKLSAADKERDQLESTREEWMTGISHDLRTPLSTIQGYAYLLESGQYRWTEEELQDMGRFITEKGDYMTALIEDFSLAFQLKNQSLPHQLKPADLNKLVRGIMLKFINDLTLEDVSFNYEGTDSAVFIQADIRWFERMLDNLIYNCIKHNPKGTCVTASVSRQGESAIVNISDNGAGMDQETVQHLFERYYRGTNTDEQTEGAGLGMSIARAIAELHGGSIHVSSVKNRGTIFRLEFPLEKDLENEGQLEG